MPSYIVRDPETGKTLRLQGDSEPTEQELIEIFSSYPQQQAAAQDSPGIADLFTGQSRQTDEIQGLPEIGAAPELNSLSVPAFKASLGLLTTGDDKSLQGVLSAQFGDEVKFRKDEKDNTIVDFPSGSYVLNKPGLSFQDVARAAFDILSFTPAGRAAGITTAIGANAATQTAIEGATQSLGGDDISGSDVALAGALGGGFKLAENVLGAGYRALRGSSDNQLVGDAAETGIPILTSDVLPADQFATKALQETGEKIPFFGTGSIRAEQQRAREAAVADVAERYGQFSYDAIVGSLKSEKNRIKREAGDILEATARPLDGIGEIPLNNTLKAIEDAKDELTKKGVIRSSGAIADLQTLMNALSEAPQSFTTLKENRTAFREILEGADKAERSQLTSRSKSLLQNVQSAMKKDSSEFARNNLTEREFKRWNRANAIYFEEAQKLTNTTLKNALDKGDVTPEAVSNLLFSKKPSDVRRLYDSLDFNGRQNAKSAIISKVVGDLSGRASGFTPNSFASEMKKQKIPLNIFFEGKEKKQLDGLLHVLDSTRRAQDAKITTPSGQSLIGIGAGVSAFVDLGATVGSAATLGSITRIYENTAVRNALIKLGNSKKGTSAFEKNLKDAMTSINSITQASLEN